ncbi:MAG: DUF4190 domain-containing protein [Clostridiales bacterium]|nr:MAG: DUF4190 domain-containing protein [Clostridiales bacterium]
MDDFTPDQQLGQQPEPEQNAQHVPTPDVPYDNPPPQEGPTVHKQPQPVYQPPQQPPFYQPPQEYQYQVPAGQTSGSNNLAVAALICGILGIVLCWIPYVCFLALILSICAVVFGAMGMKKAGANGRGMAIAGLVCGIVSLGLTLIVVACAAAVFCAAAIEPLSYYAGL